MYPLQFIQNSLTALATSYYSFHDRAPFKLPYIGLLGLATHPLYYIVWTHWLPQDYESPELRFISMCLCLALALERWWPSLLRPHYFVFAYLALLFCLPFFFTFMLLMNNGSDAWLMSATVATLFVVQLYDFRNGMVVLVVGNFVAITAYLLIHGWVDLPEPFLLSIPVYAFAISAVGFLTYNERHIADERLLAAQALASNIAHEMRTPLLGIRFDCERIQEDFEVQDARVYYDATPSMAAARSKEVDDDIRTALHRILQQSISASMAIDMILLKVKHQKFDHEEFKITSIQSAVQNAMERYPFRKGERDAVHIKIEENFGFWGSELLMVHVLFNLLKNALGVISLEQGDTITIIAKQSGTISILQFHDTGPGISKEIESKVFTPFATSGLNMEGTGLGLAFCKNVIESFGGTVSFQARSSGGTTFTISFPNIDPNKLPHEFHKK